MLLILLFTLFASGVLLWLIRPHNKSYAGWLSVLPPAVVAGWLLAQVEPLADGIIYTQQVAWIPSLNLELAFRLDGLAILFGLIISVIGAGIALYTHYYLEDDPEQGRFYAFLFAFMASMLGLVWSDNVLSLFVFWEGTSITSYLLIGFKHKEEKSRKGANMALVITGFGGLFMLAGFVLLGQAAGTYTISEILATPGLMNAAVFPYALGLMLLGAFTKSAQFPFHFWLPGAMAAPTPASAYLHSATMVKAGIYLLARMHPAFSESPIWYWSLLTVGAITMTIGAIFALSKSDLKGLLAYATVSQLGILVMLLALNSKEAAVAVVVGITAHALYKGPLFMVAGIIDHATHTRNIHRLAKLIHTMPLVSGVAILAALSMAGLPPFFGFLAKETLLESLFHEFQTHGGVVPMIEIGLTALAGAFFVAYSLTLIWEPFLRRQAPENPAQMHHAPKLPIILPALVLVAIGFVVLFGLESWDPLLFDPTSSAIMGSEVETHLALWHGITPYLITSVIAIVVGTLIFFARNRIRAWLAGGQIDGAMIFDMTISGIYATARAVTHFIQGRTLSTHVMVVFLAAIAVLVYAAQFMNWGEHLQPMASPIRFIELVLVIASIIAAYSTIRARSRLNGIVSLGAVGIVVTMFFVFFDAPDLALTQLLIEVLTVVLLVLVFYRYPFNPRQPFPKAIIIRNVIVAVVIGVFGFVFVLINAQPFGWENISTYYYEQSIPGGHGGNVVNVILVDFRGFDTMGEISVLGIAAVGAYALLRSTRLHIRKESSAPIAAESAPSTSGTADKVENEQAVEAPNYALHDTKG
ncbi:DUF4040 domain-containing protein [bacterium]|nr:DUF4040 domain-containing protein [bacterium]